MQAVIAVICIVLITLCVGVVGFSVLRNVQTGAADTPPPRQADGNIGVGGTDDTGGTNGSGDANGTGGTNDPEESSSPSNGDTANTNEQYPPADEPGQTSPGADDNNTDDTVSGPDADPEPPRSQRFPFPGIISRHTTNTADIAFLQNTLTAIRNYYTSIRPIDVAFGSFDGATRGAVIDFQVRAALPPTGIVDEDTWYAIIHVFENPPAMPDPPFIPTVDVGYVTLVNLHLRESPSTAAESLGIKPEGTVVRVVSYIPGDRWFFVTTADDVVGYMKAEFLLMEGILP